MPTTKKRSMRLFCLLNSLTRDPPATQDELARCCGRVLDVRRCKNYQIPLRGTLDVRRATMYYEAV